MEKDDNPIPLVPEGRLLPIGEVNPLLSNLHRLRATTFFAQMHYMDINIADFRKLLDFLATIIAES
jgi:hypothetical protein